MGLGPATRSIDVVAGAFRCHGRSHRGRLRVWGRASLVV